MEAQLLKLADLQIDQSYWVVGYKPINTKYGDTYIIQCVHLGSEKEVDFEMFATKLIASYISKYSLDNSLPIDKFLFTVRKNSKYTYAEISGYNPSTSFTRLK